MTNTSDQTSTVLPDAWPPAVRDAFWTAVNAPSYEDSAAATLAFAQLLIAASPAVVEPPADQTALERVQAMHQPTQGLGYDCDEDDTPGSYGEIAQVCTTCGTHDEYGVRWPCATFTAIDGVLRRMADETQPAEPAAGARQDGAET
jgi:hypothetical protein